MDSRGNIKIAPPGGIVSQQKGGEWKVTRAEELAKKLSASWMWDDVLVRELCVLADMEKEWMLAKSEEKYEKVIAAAAKKLGVVLGTPNYSPST